MSFVDFDFEAAVIRPLPILLSWAPPNRPRSTACRIGWRRNTAPLSAPAGFECALVEHQVDGATIPCEPTYEAGKLLARRLAAEWPGGHGGDDPKNDALGGLVAGS